MEHDFWSKVTGLKGRTLLTLRGKEFDVVGVAPDKVTVVPRSSGKARVVSSRELTAAVAIPTGTAGLTASQVRSSGASEMNPVYVVAILKEIAKVL